MMALICSELSPISDGDSEVSDDSSKRYGSFDESVSGLTFFPLCWEFLSCNLMTCHK